MTTLHCRKWSYLPHNPLQVAEQKGSMICGSRTCRWDLGLGCLPKRCKVNGWEMEGFGSLYAHVGLFGVLFMEGKLNMGWKYGEGGEWCMGRIWGEEWRRKRGDWGLGGWMSAYMDRSRLDNANQPEPVLFLCIHFLNYQYSVGYTSTNFVLAMHSQK